jgi:hypothetical protein
MVAFNDNEPSLPLAACLNRMLTVDLHTEFESLNAKQKFSWEANRLNIKVSRCVSLSLQPLPKFELESGQPSFQTFTAASSRCFLQMRSRSKLKNQIQSLYSIGKSD